MRDECLNRFDGVIYINLVHRTDRKKLLLNELRRLETKKDKIHRIDAEYDLLNGHRGCALSHAKAMQYAMDKGWKHTLILEDDCFFTKDPKVIDAKIHYFLHSIGNDWDVFFLGGNIKSYERTPFPGIYRALMSLCAHAYVVHKDYLNTLKTLFLYSHKQMSSDPFFFDSVPRALDINWNYLMIKDRWYFTEIMAHQRGSFSDIQKAHRDRTHREKFL